MATTCKTIALLYRRWTDGHPWSLTDLVLNCNYLGVPIFFLSSVIFCKCRTSKGLFKDYISAELEYFSHEYSYKAQIKPATLLCPLLFCECPDVEQINNSLETFPTSRESTLGLHLKHLLHVKRKGLRDRSLGLKCLIVSASFTYYITFFPFLLIQAGWGLGLDILNTFFTHQVVNGDLLEYNFHTNEHGLLACLMWHTFPHVCLPYIIAYISTTQDK